jgi:hypothetical protein
MLMIGNNSSQKQIQILSKIYFKYITIHSIDLDIIEAIFIIVLFYIEFYFSINLTK